MDELKNLVKKVVVFVEGQKHSYITTEHLVYVSLDEPPINTMCVRNNIDSSALKKDLMEVLKHTNTLKGENSGIMPTAEYLQLLTNAQSYASTSANSTISLVVLKTVLEGNDGSYCKYLLLKHKIDLALVQESLKTISSSTFLSKYSVELVSVALDGKIDNLVGRQSEIESIIRILSRRKNSCPLLVGVNGCGKTAIAEGFALKIACGEVPDSCKDFRVYAIDMGSMIAGTKFRGEFEERLTNVFKELSADDNAIGFIDEIHTIVGAGSGSDSSLDASNILKPYLSSGSVRLIGSTTYDEYKNLFQKDKALSRRFKKIDVSEPSESETLQIIHGLKGIYEAHHGISYDDDVLASLVKLSGKYINDRNFPDKAIDVMDEIGSKYRSKLYTGDKATLKDVEEVICRMANLPSISTGDNEMEDLRYLSSLIKSNLFGQDEIVDSIHQKIKIAKAGFRDPNKPLITSLFVGPSGVGKTLLAKELASKLGIGFVHLDMSEYKEEYSVSRLIGSAPGYVGYEQSGSLTEPLIRTPHCVVLLDEIEKAHKSVFDLLLQVLDEGRLTDNHGREASFKNAIVLMTSNIGCSDASNKKASVGFGYDASRSASDRKGIIEAALTKGFAPEFRNRLQSIYYFNELGIEQLDLIVKKSFSTLEDVLASHDAFIDISDDVVRFLSEKALSEKLGGRPVQRIVEREITERIVDHVLFDGVKKIKVMLKDDGLEFDYCQK